MAWRKLDAVWTKCLVGFLDAGVKSPALRQMALRKAEQSLYHHFVILNPGNSPRRCQEDKFQLVSNMFGAIDRALTSGRISRPVRHALLRILVGKVLMGEKTRHALFVEKYGFAPPGFVTISPAKQCNLYCEGCYAGSTTAKVNLDYDIVNRVVNETRQSWGSHFVVISGGEPLMWHSRGKGIMDLLEENPDTYFMMYTNATLIDEKMAARMAQTGNVTPAISVEGFEAETDRRRGKGVFGRILNAMENLREARVPFGISATATRENAELLVSDRFVDFYFEEQGAIYGWIFQYMPIGRSYTLERMITPEQRLMMYQREQALVYERKLFLADFWNSGPVANGCIAAARPGGYLYIDWNGKVSPCVFFPYSTHNIVEVYEAGGDLNTVITSPFFEAIRKWQRGYGYGQPPERVQNEITPCAIRDHYRVARGVVKRFAAKPIDEDAAEAIRDERYFQELVAYGEKVNELTSPIWEAEYVGPERRRVAA
ncbi:MAG: radical SAM/SPASM domain-containing protein [bacterium]|jgi:MoaA/NifB/PqqE/SkfB family radical SAM enzyme|nr:radical SAM protein [candidate division KSB1 bacterium]MDH7560942.1 radical SAM/SPASM domain-containing protein [bacterium]